MYKCTICDKEFEVLSTLSKHYGRMHKKPIKQLYLDLFCEGIEPTCKCGCRSQVKFINIEQGFREFVVGHSSRIKNNWGHSKKARENSLKTRRKMIEDGTWKPFALNETGEIWNKGLTKETNKSVAKMAETISNNSDEILSRKERMKKGRLDGTIPTLVGENHSQWKGGISSLNQVCRTNKRLYRKWIRPILESFRFQCAICGCKGRLEVHHDKETFSEIIRKIAKKYNWNFKLTEQLEKDNPAIGELKKQISNEVAEYHVQNNVSGKALCSKCHKQKHVIN